MGEEDVRENMHKDRWIKIFFQFGVRNTGRAGREYTAFRDISITANNGDDNYFFPLFFFFLNPL